MDHTTCCDHAERLDRLERRVDALFRNLSRVDEGIKEKTGTAPIFGAEASRVTEYPTACPVIALR
jgi:hypothetical protein